jgi:hypothetical protein
MTFDDGEAVDNEAWVKRSLELVRTSFLSGLLDNIERALL